MHAHTDKATRPQKKPLEATRIVKEPTWRMNATPHHCTTTVELEARPQEATDQKSRRRRRRRRKEGNKESSLQNGSTVFFKPGKRLLCACACEREREKDVAGVLVELEASSARSTAHPLYSQTHKTLENSSATTKSKSFVAEERTNGRERVGARASERASSTVVDPRWRETQRERRPLETAGHRVPPAPRRPAGSDPLFLRKSKIRKHYVDSKKKTPPKK